MAWLKPIVRAWMIIVGFILFITNPTYAQQTKKHTIAGHIRDSTSQEALLGATIFSSTTTSGATSNNYGFYSITLTEGTHTLQFSFVGYQPVIKTITLTADLRLNISLAPYAVGLEEVVVSGTCSPSYQPYPTTLS